MPAIQPTITSVFARQFDDVGQALGGAAETVGGGISTGVSAAGGGVATAVSGAADIPNAAVSGVVQKGVDEGVKQSKAQLQKYVPYIVGGGIVALIALIVLGFWWSKRRNRNKRAKKDPEDFEKP